MSVLHKCLPAVTMAVAAGLCANAAWASSLSLPHHASHAKKNACPTAVERAGADKSKLVMNPGLGGNTTEEQDMRKAGGDGKAKGNGMLLPAVKPGASVAPQAGGADASHGTGGGGGAGKGPAMPELPSGKSQ